MRENFVGRPHDAAPTPAPDPALALSWVCGRPTRIGAPCQLRAGHATEHLGQGPCRAHGGRTWIAPPAPTTVQEHLAVLDATFDRAARALEEKRAQRHETAGELFDRVRRGKLERAEVARAELRRAGVQLRLVDGRIATAPPIESLPRLARAMVHRYGDAFAELLAGEYTRARAGEHAAEVEAP